ncbi:MAG: hypothetical protein LUC24_04645 [Bacteroidales bacterium]|nr:hypothetical protein [Bacteroidales bacterium]
MKKLFYCILCAGIAFIAGSASLLAQTGSKTVTTTKLESDVSTFESTESIRLDNVAHEMLVMPLVASVQVISPKKADGSYQRATFTGLTRTDVPAGLNKNEYLASKVYDGKFLIGINLELLKAQATYDFCAENGADLIVLPQFNIHHRMETVNAVDDKGKTIQMDVPVEINGKYVMVVDIVGYPAIYTNFRDGDPNDRWIKSMLREGQVSGNSEVVSTEDKRVKVE